MYRDLGVDLRDEPGAGAAGGLGFGLMAFLGARVRPGVDVVADALGLPSRVAAADLAITGEGRLDAQSLRGKVPAGYPRGSVASSRSPWPSCAVRPRRGCRLDGVTVVSLVERFGRDEALGDARRSLERLAAGARRAERTSWSATSRKGQR